MASISKRRNKYYARITWYSNHKRKEIQIPLKTSSLGAARKRLKAVNNEESDILNGITKPFQFRDIFKWLNPDGTSKYIDCNLDSIIPDYLEYRICMVRKSTVQRDRVSLKQLSDFFGKPKPIEELSYKNIEGINGLIQHLRNKGCKDTGINITLRHLKIFFNWLYLKEKLIPEPLRFKIIKTGMQLPRYFNEREIKAIQKLKDLDDFFKKIFVFYEQTGCRPKEPFLGEIIGDWLIIDPKFTKGKNVRQIPLNENHKSILIEMQKFRNSHINKDQNKDIDRANDKAYDIIARKIMSTVRELGFTGKSLSLKSFRHTYGIKRVTITGNIYQVMREMGHSQVTTTQLYLEFPEQRRLDDFPSLRKYIERDMVANSCQLTTSKRSYAISPIPISN